MPNERLRTAMVGRQVDVETLARVADVDTKTVERWLNGRQPHPPSRWAAAQLLGEEEGYLWPSARPDLSPGADASNEVVAAYGHRADVPTAKWADLLATARREINLIGYSLLFLPEQHVDLVSTIEKACAGGCRVRIMLADPQGTATRVRDELEELDGTLAARINTTLKHLGDIHLMPGVEIRLHNVHLYNAALRFDDDMIVTPYLVGSHGFQHPALQLRRLGPYGIFASFAAQAEHIWASSKPIPPSPPPRRTRNS